MPWLSWIISNVVLASLLGLAAWFVQRRLRLHGVARILWVLVLVKLVTPPLVSVPLVELPGSMACTLGACGCGHHGEVQSMVRDSMLWGLLGIWVSGAGAMGWIAWRRTARFRQLMDHATPVPPQWQALAAHLSISTKLSFRRLPEILAVPGRLPPLVVAGRRGPRIVLPIELIGRLNATQRKALLLHELVHIHRGDHLVRQLELMVGVVFWWLPLVGWIGRQLRACEETCCDAAVLAHVPLSRRNYARLILDVLDFANPLPRSAVAQATTMSAAGGLEQRLRAILDADPPARRAWPAMTLAVAVACAILPCQLQYDFSSRDAARRPAAAVSTPDRGPAVETISKPSVDAKGAPILISVGCCPS